MITWGRTAFDFVLEKWPLFFGLFLSAAALYVLRCYEHSTFDPLHAAGEVLTALFIAFLLAILVDPFLKQTLLKEGIRSIYKYIYGYSLPQILKDYFEKEVVGSKMMRVNCNLQWKLAPAEASSTHVHVSIQVSFGVWNYFSQEQNYEHTAFAFSDEPQGKASVQSMYCLDNETGKYRYDRTTKLVPAEVPEQQDHDQKQNGPKKDIKPIKPEIDSVVSLEPSDDPNRTTRYTFGARYDAEASWPTGSDEFFVKELTRDVKVVVIVDKALTNLYFDLIPATGTNSGWKQALHDDHEDDYRCTWHLKRLFVPNETILLRWREAEIGRTEADPAAGI